MNLSCCKLLTNFNMHLGFMYKLVKLIVHDKDPICRWYGVTALFPPPPPPPPPPPLTSHELQYISLTSGFTRLSMKTKYVCRGLINLYVNFHSNWKMWSKNSHVKNCRWGGGGGGEPG